MTTEKFPPDEGTPEYFDYLLDGLEAEVRLSERYSIELESIQFYKDALRAAYSGQLSGIMSGNDKRTDSKSS